MQCGDPGHQAALERLGLERPEDGVEAVVRGDAAGEVEELAEPVLLLASPVGDGHEVVGPGDGGAQGDGDDVDERISDLAPSGVGQAGEVLVDAGGEVAGHEGRSRRAHDASDVGSTADTTRVVMPSSSQTTHHGAIALGLEATAAGSPRPPTPPSHPASACPFTVVVPPLQGMYNRAAMRAKDTARCTNCRRLQARVDALEAELAALKQVVAQLGQQLAAARKDSSTSSKPPSSDIVKPPKPPPPRGPGPSAASAASPATPSTSASPSRPRPSTAGPSIIASTPAPRCGHDLQPMPTIAAAGRPAGRHRARCRCRSRSTAVIRGGARAARRCYEAPLPPGIERGGLVGPSLTTLIAYLKGACHASFSTVRKFLRDVVGVTISRGQLAKIIGKVSRALERPYRGVARRPARPGAAQRR